MILFLLDNLQEDGCPIVANFGCVRALEDKVCAVSKRKESAMKKTYRVKIVQVQ